MANAPKGSSRGAPLIKVSLETIVAEALNDCEADQVPSRLLNSDAFPARSELAKHGLTEVNYLALQQSEPEKGVIPAGIIYSIPGGAASGLAFTIMNGDLTGRHDSARSRQAARQINVFLMVHGAIAPNPPIYWNFCIDVESPRGPCVPAPRHRNPESNEHGMPGWIPAEECELFKRGFHAHNINARGNFLLGQLWYEKLSCGGGGENTLDTRAQAWETYLELEKKWAVSTNPSVRFFIVEAIAPITGLPRVRIYCDDYPFEEFRTVVDPLKAFERPGDNYRPLSDEELTTGNAPAQFSCRDYPVENLLPYRALNDILRRLMDQGEDIVGIGCSDARQGLCIGPEREEDLSNDTAFSNAVPDLKVQHLRRENLAGHSEPIGLILLSANMQKVAYYLISHHLFIRRREPSIFPAIVSPAWPFLVNVPRALWSGNSQAITHSLEQLLSAVDQGYRKTLSPFSVAPRIYIASNGALREVVTHHGRPLRGLRFIYPSELQDGARHIRPGLRAIKVSFEIRGMSSHHVRTCYDRRSADTFTFEGCKEPSTASRQGEKSVRGIRRALHFLSEELKQWISSGDNAHTCSGRRSVGTDVEYARVFNEPLSSNGVKRKSAQANVGWMLPLSRRELGIPVPPDRPGTL